MSGSSIEGFTLPPVIFGNMARRRQSRTERIAVVRAALDLGLTTIDTAPLYDFGAAEEQLAEALSGVAREQVQILSKVGLRWDAGAAGEVFFNHTADGGTITVRRDSRPQSLRWQVEQSLKRLDTDYLDLVQIHQPDRQTPLAESLEALDALRREGKVRALGVCNLEPDELTTAAAAVPLSSVQLPYNLLERRVEQRLLNAARHHGIRVLAYSPLAGGELSGDRLQALGAGAQTVADVADACGAAENVVPLAWVLSRPGVDAVITGASSVDQVKALAGAPHRLPDAAVARLDRAFRAAADRRALQGTAGLRRALRRLRIWRSRLSS